MWGGWVFRNPMNARTADRGGARVLFNCDIGRAHRPLRVVSLIYLIPFDSSSNVPITLPPHTPTQLSKIGVFQVDLTVSNFLLVLDNMVSADASLPSPKSTPSSDHSDDDDDDDGIFEIGSIVQLSPTYRSHSDASSGPLPAHGGTGTVTEVQGEGGQVRVEYCGRRWWYRPEGE